MIWVVLPIDMNNDGKLDVVIGQDSGPAYCALQETGRVFGPLELCFSMHVRGMGSGDVDGDGQTDIVVVDGGATGSIAVLFINISTPFPTTVNLDSDYAWAQSANIVDLTGDGHPDVVACCTWLRGGGGATSL